MKSYKPAHLQKKMALKKKAIKRKRFVRSRIFFDIVLAFLFIGTLIYFLFFSKVFQIKDIQIDTFTEASKESILKVVNEEMQKKFLYFFQRDSFFLLHSKEIENKIFSTFSLVSKVEVKRGLWGSVFVEVKPRIAQTIWCFNEGKDCFLADQQGVIFKQLEPFYAPENDLVFVNSENPTKAIFREACSSSSLERILETKNVLNSLGIFNPTFIEKASGFLYVKTIEGWTIYFSPKQDLASDMLKLKILLGKEISLEKRKTLEYIDLRFSKAYYK